MLGYNLVLTLGAGSLLAFAVFYFFNLFLKWGGSISALATAALMLLIYVPLSVTHWEGIDVFAIHFAFFMMIPYGLGIIKGVQKERYEIEGEDAKKGMHWIPASIIVFFILLAVVDSVIISFATSGMGTGIAKLLLPEGASKDVGKDISSQFTGAVSNDLQDEEKKFDHYVDQLKKQRQRGWKISGGWDNSPVLNKNAVFRLHVNDKSDISISGANVTIIFRRSSDRNYDKLYTLKESQERGVYSTSVSLPLPGCWTMKIIAKKGNDQHEIKGETEVSTMVDGKLFTPQCVDGEPDIDEKRRR